MFLTNLFFLLTAHVLVFGQPCPEGWRSYEINRSASCYLFSKSETTFLEAVLSCYYKASLVGTPLSVKQKDFFGADTGSEDCVFTGFYKVGGAWRILELFNETQEKIDFYTAQVLPQTLNEGKNENCVDTPKYDPCIATIVKPDWKFSTLRSPLKCFYRCKRIMCEPGKWGVHCDQECDQDCVDGLCNAVTGQCSRGAKAGSEHQASTSGAPGSPLPNRFLGMIGLLFLTLCVEF